jgi:hypothetical protein
MKPIRYLWRIVGLDKARADDTAPRAPQLAWRGESQRIAKDNYCIGVLGGRGKGDVKFLHRGCLYYRQGHVEVLGCAGQLRGYYQPVNWIARIDQDRNFSRRKEPFRAVFLSFCQRSVPVRRSKDP